MLPRFACRFKSMLLGARERLQVLEGEAELRSAFTVSQTLQGMSISL